MSTFEQFCEFIEQHCPTSMRTPMSSEETIWGGRQQQFNNPDSKAWLDIMVDAGYTAPTWPAAFGGAGLSPAEAKLLQKAMLKLGARPPLMSLGVHMMGPTILEFGTEAQQQEHLPPIARGEIRWCQGYSEPGAGSDLASLSCKAEDCGDHFLVNGQKVWTSFADKSDFLFCLVRTDFNVAKHDGISVLLIDMALPGVTTKPIELISGSSHFCEVFLDNVQVPKHQLLGQLNHGWGIAKRMLQHERNMMGSRDLGNRFAPSFDSVVAHQHGQSLAEFSPILRDQIAANAMQTEAIELTSQRMLQEFKQGQVSQASSCLKLAMSEAYMQKFDLYLQAFGFAGLSWPDDRNANHFSADELLCAKEWAFSRIQSIGGGTSEIQLNIIAKRNLGLPD